MDSEVFFMSAVIYVVVIATGGREGQLGHREQLLYCHMVNRDEFADVRLANQGLQSKFVCRLFTRRVFLYCLSR